ncbi:hypothetical protein AVEN_243760-1 [Araneus ventricosus]|uniref:Uncharacterized protein n=1 Tax=Araneus ventricosus TaxID=182803 RepID=A0A4Y2A5I2_ARAVE|nr:hypothetical protein AVEN_243760-1 [Araneus ventricosus]
MTIGTVDLQTTQQLQRTATRKAKSQALEKARFGKFQLDGLKPCEILREENVKVCNNNDIVVDKNTPPCSTPQTRLELATFARTCDRYAVADRSVPLLHQHCFMILATAHQPLLIKTLESCHMPDGSQLPFYCFDFT